MKTLTLETGSIVELYNVGEDAVYPIQSIPGCGKKDHGGWIMREIQEPTMIVRLRPTDALSAGFAVPLDKLTVKFELIAYDRYIELICAHKDEIEQKDAWIAELEKQIRNLKKTKKCKR